MLILLAVTIGGLVTAGVYMIQRRNAMNLLFGLLLISHAANLLIFTLGGLARARPPLIAEGALAPEPGFSDPLPQALVLTAIVIGFAVIAFLAVLIKRVQKTLGTGDTDAMQEAER